MEKFIKVPGIYKKLKSAEKEKLPIYIKAATGFGKTTSVLNYYKNKNVLVLSGQDGFLQDMVEINKIKESTIIIDDISWITDEKSREYINNLINEKSAHIVMMGRSKMPEWLNETLITNSFILADEKDLMFSVKLIKELFYSNELYLSDDDFAQLAKDTQGYPLIVMIAFYEIQSHENYSEIVRESIRIHMFKFFNNSLYEKWSERLRQFLMMMANFDSFNVQFAEMVTLLGNIPMILIEAESVGDFLVKHENGIYEIRPALKNYLIWKQQLVQDKEWRENIYRRAAIYYEMNDKIELALRYYNLIDESMAISRILIKNAEKHPGTGHYYEMRNYYINLPEEKLKKSPVLMAGVSMVYSIILQPEMSEKWYSELEKYEREAASGSSEKTEAKRRLVYLDIALPHRGIVKMMDILRSASVLFLTKNIVLPEFSVTSNLPSILNGGKDFSNWTKNDKTIAKLLKIPVEMILQKYGVGLMDICLGESFFEKDNTEIYEIMTLFNSGYTKADAGGKIEICFAAVAGMCKIHIKQNQINVARMQLNEFKKKVKLENALRLMNNINAMENWFNLLEGKEDLVLKWIQEEAPNEHMEFYVLDRYRYLMKVRSYLALGRNEEAILLIERLSIYFEKYNRNYMWIENQILKSIAQYRIGLGNWKETFNDALNKAEKYKFVFVVAKEGAAIMPLFTELTEFSINPSYKEQIYEKTEKISLIYPNYLKVKKDILEDLTDAERKIFELYCDGIESKKICDELYISYNTLKYHNKNLYRKLGVKSRIEAVKKAKELGVL